HAQMTDVAGDRDLWIVGGGDLAGQFADAGLLDEVWVQYAPVTLGDGAPLLPRPLSMELLETVRNRALVCTRFAVTK
ncbi:dihydrofolate reductase family protein, partial [Corynebacterium glyciniphilum]